jgi:gliding motility associated protien GldN
MSIKDCLLLLAGLPAITGNAQLIPSGNPVPPKPCPPSQYNDKKPVAYDFVREADVMWSKTVWRTLDMREKINLPLYYPLEEDNCRNSLWEVIKRGIMEGKITAYGDPVFDDEFRHPLTIEQAAKVMFSKDTVVTINPNTLLPETVLVDNQVTPDKIMRYWVKEVWFFDRERSVMEVRIVGICPLIEKMDPNTGEFRAYSPLFWLYFDECRPVFAKEPVLWWKANTAAQPSLDEVFQKRIFSSFIHKESNVYNRKIIEYKQGMDALLEAEKFKEDIFNFEHDLWHY